MSAMRRSIATIDRLDSKLDDGPYKARFYLQNSL